MSLLSQTLSIKPIRLFLPNIFLTAIILVGISLVIGIFSLLSYQIHFLGCIHSGVQIGGVDVGKLTPDETRYIVNRQAAELIKRPITLITNEGEWTFYAAELGAIVDINQTINSAFSVGRSGNLWQDLWTQYRVYHEPVNILPVVRLDTGPSNGILANIAHAIDRPMHQAQLVIDANLNVHAIQAQIGRKVNIEASRKAIYQAILSQHNHPVRLSVDYQQPTITEVNTAYQAVSALLSQPLILTFEDKVWSLSPIVLKEILVVGQKNDTDGIVHVAVGLNQSILYNYFEQIAADIYQESIDARFEFNEYTKSLLTLSPSQDGYTLDVAAAMNMVTDLLHTPHQHQLTLPVIVESPSVSGENATTFGIESLINSSTSYFSGSSQERMENINVSAQKFHGVVIPPDELFSFNTYLGEVTAENGFVESLIIRGDRTAVGVGGGVCQVSTTAFRAALYGGFEIVERWAHGYRVSWYETESVPGLDATIYSPWIDFKFRNDTDTYILIQTETDLIAGTVTFNIYGQPSNRTISISEPILENHVPPPPPVYEEDSSLSPGDEKQIEWAKDGIDVTVTRTVSESNTIIHRDEFFSRYQPWAAVYKIAPSEAKEEEKENDNSSESEN